MHYPTNSIEWHCNNNFVAALLLLGETDQEIKPSAKNLRNLWPAIYLAQKMGEALG